MGLFLFFEWYKACLIWSNKNLLEQLDDSKVPILKNILASILFVDFETKFLSEFWNYPKLVRRNWYHIWATSYMYHIIWTISYCARALAHAQIKNQTQTVKLPDFQWGQVLCSVRLFFQLWDTYFLQTHFPDFGLGLEKMLYEVAFFGYL